MTEQEQQLLFRKWRAKHGRQTRSMMELFGDATKDLAKIDKAGFNPWDPKHLPPYRELTEAEVCARKYREMVGPLMPATLARSMTDNVPGATEVFDQLMVDRYMLDMQDSPETIAWLAARAKVL